MRMYLFPKQRRISAFFSWLSKPWLKEGEISPASQLCGVLEGAFIEDPSLCHWASMFLALSHYSSFPLTLFFGQSSLLSEALSLLYPLARRHSSKSHTWFFLICFLFGGKLLFSVVLISAIQHESTINVHISPPSWMSHPSRSSQSPELSSPCYRAGSHWLSALHMVMCICQCCSSDWFHPLLPLVCPQVHSLHPCLYSCPANRFISTSVPLWACLRTEV